MPEQELDHLEGYMGSRPVRIGNGAANQLQLDIYGELLDAVYLYDKYGTPIAWEFWQDIVKYVDWVCANWDRPDEGIWEVRGEREHFVYSKLMCWGALDRALRLADKRSLPAPRNRWVESRDTIYKAIMERGWSEERGAFVQAFGGTTLDASNLLMPLVFFTGPNDPRMIATLEETLRAPEEGGLTSDCLVWRYNTGEVDDGVGGEEGAFNLCSFWLVEALARAGRIEPAYLEKARVMFEKMLGYSNHLGLFAEMTGLSGQALGNFPQAFSHLGLISAAYNIDRALDERGPGQRSGQTPSEPEQARSETVSLHPGAEPNAHAGPTGAR
jgi:GH15 family glucan-1,4-alpha-glucosidase